MFRLDTYIVLVCFIFFCYTFWLYFVFLTFKACIQKKKKKKFFLLPSCETGKSMCMCLETKSCGGYPCWHRKPQKVKLLEIYSALNFSVTFLTVQRWPCAASPFRTISKGAFLTRTRDGVVIVWQCKQSSCYCPLVCCCCCPTFSLLYCAELSLCK